tara:strand:- start:155 stop:526 length:372 start_codon:yes stop_codon:yes gene_type:complete
MDLFYHNTEHIVTAVSTTDFFPHVVRVGLMLEFLCPTTYVYGEQNYVTMLVPFLRVDITTYFIIYWVEPYHGAHLIPHIVNNSIPFTCIIDETPATNTSYYLACGALVTAAAASAFFLAARLV